MGRFEEDPPWPPPLEMGEIWETFESHTERRGSVRGSVPSLVIADEVVDWSRPADPGPGRRFEGDQTMRGVQVIAPRDRVRSGVSGFGLACEFGLGCQEDGAFLVWVAHEGTLQLSILCGSHVVRVVAA